MAADTTHERTGGGASDYLAAERTFLAWIRTGLALMGFGFVVARFGLFLQALQFGQPNLPLRSTGISPLLGTSLIALGILVNIGSAWSHVRLMRHLKQGGTEFFHPSSLAIALAAVLAILGLAMAAYLLIIREPGTAQVHASQENTMTSNANHGIVTLPSRQSVEQTVQKLEDLLRAKGIKLFAVIDHSGEAERAGMHMPPTKLLIFGNPKAGTPLMIAAPSVAIDLPLKILVWEDGQGKVWVSYNAAAYLQARHDLPAELLPNIAGVEALAAGAAQ